ncbi:MULTISPECIES: DoxX family protein [Tsukamurella]|uniref:DoxX family protein n=2 Tax=Tsukamurella TaxID=2060 RepID=A0A5C5S1D1_9ACTN|nr:MULTISPECIES: DoxX family protein [Tsukamurella]NMD56195.1 DoxX family protein [Tsukamurella columbiensis]TWS28712.1 DoxX family protein [Tsukamurella conjunctivitidis]
MITALLIATLACIVANAGIAIADFVPAAFVLKNSAEVRVPARAVPYLATLKLAGAAGLTIGLLGAPWLGLAAGIGLVAFFLGAVGVHVRAGVYYNIAFPGAFLVLALASMTYFILRVA